MRGEKEKKKKTGKEWRTITITGKKSQKIEKIRKSNKKKKMAKIWKTGKIAEI